MVKDPYKSPGAVSFIAGQAPIPSNYPAFVNLLLTLLIPLIITIGERQEIPKKINGYWLPKENQLGDGQPYFEHVKFLSDNGFAHESIIQVQNTTLIGQANKPAPVVKKFIWHMHLYTWRDNLPPSHQEFEPLIEIVDRLIKFRKQFPLDGPDVWYFIHCSSGLGRTGTFMASFYLLAEYRKAAEKGITFKFSVFELAGKIRTMRYGAILKTVQYQFLYDLFEYLVKRPASTSAPAPAAAYAPAPAAAYAPAPAAAYAPAPAAAYAPAPAASYVSVSAAAAGA